MEEHLGRLQHLHLGGLVAEAMALILKQPNLHRDAIAAQGSCHAFGLLRGDNLVLKPLKKQRRAADLIGVLQGRACVVERPLCRPGSHQSIEITGFKSVGFFRHRSEITDGVAAGADTKYIGEAERCQGGESSCAAAFYGDLIGSGAAGMDQRLSRRRAVGHIHHPPATVESLAVVASEACGSAVVHIHHPPAPGGPVLDAELKAAAGHGGGTAVTLHQ